MENEIEQKLLRATNSLILSIMAHPDYTGEENAEWTDLVEIAEEAIEGYKAALSKGNGWSDEDLLSNWLSLSADEKIILGRPNFACGAIAEQMRNAGFECNHKAEDEQALVIFIMLQFYNKYRQDWALKIGEYLQSLKSKTTT